MNDIRAFPTPDANFVNKNWGMTLRDYFAAKAMQSITPILYENVEPDYVYECIAGDAYLLADAMMKAREQ